MAGKLFFRGDDHSEETFDFDDWLYLEDMDKYFKVYEIVRVIKEYRKLFPDSYPEIYRAHLKETKHIDAEAVLKALGYTEDESNFLSEYAKECLEYKLYEWMSMNRIYEKGELLHCFSKDIIDCFAQRHEKGQTA